MIIEGEPNRGSRNIDDTYASTRCKSLMSKIADDIFEAANYLIS